MKKYFINFLGMFLLLTLNLNAQKLAPERYWIQFTDKNNTQYTINSPDEFLSERAIERRKKQGIAITKNDLPVNQTYLDSLNALGVDILHTSKWLNATIVKSVDSLLMDTISKLNFVTSYKNKIKDYQDFCFTLNTDFNYSFNQRDLTRRDTLPGLGEAKEHISMINCHSLHNKNIRGQGMRIGVMDAGFNKIKSLPAFDSLFAENRVIDTWDFVNNDSLSFQTSTHGMEVLSTMAGNIPGKYSGTAPKASYCLYRTETASSEYLIEEANWIAAAERADSAGVDLINTSLGYSTFDDTSMNHTYADMDGRSTLISIAADIAVSKGMVVVVSAGNEGSSKWKYLTAPSDAKNVLSVSGVDGNRERAFFSSVGPSADGRIKPDIAAKGLFVPVQGLSEDIVYTNGTSFAAPIATGAIACLWQARPELNNLQIIETVRKNASQHSNPDSLLGYGIPDLYKSYYYPYKSKHIKNIEKNIEIHPNPFDERFNIHLQHESPKETHVELYDLMGKKIYQDTLPPYTEKTQILTKSLIHQLSEGMYILKIKIGSKALTTKLLKQ